MLVEKNVPLQPFNTFHIVAKAHALVRISSAEDLQAVLDDAQLSALPKFVLGGGSNIVLTGDVKPLVLKVEIPGKGHALRPRLVNLTGGNGSVHTSGPRPLGRMETSFSSPNRV